MIKRVQIQYERSLLNADEKKASRLGKVYYLALDDATRKAKGIINIDEKIADDFKAFNEKRFCII